MIEDDSPLPQQQVRVLQIIAFALMSGLACFGAIVVVVNHAKLAALPPMPIISLLAVGLLMTSVPMGIVVGSSVESSSVPKVVDGRWEGALPSADFISRLLTVFQTSLLIRLALVEGPGMLGGVASLTEGGWIGLVVLVAAVLVMGAMFPTEKRIRNWLSLQAERIRDSAG